MKFHTLHGWGAKALLIGLEAEPEDQAIDGVQALAFLFAGPDLWRCEAILGNLVFLMNERYARAGRDAKTATLAHTDKLTAWIQETRSIAADHRAFADDIAASMEHAADAAQAHLDWVQRRIESPPKDAASRADLFLTMYLWAFERVRETLEALGANGQGIPGRDAGRTILLAPAIAFLQDAGLPYMTTDAGWKQRVRRLRVRKGQEDNLVADVLYACRVGRYDRDGKISAA